MCDTFYDFSIKIAAIAIKNHSIVASGKLPANVSLDHSMPTHLVGFGNVSDEEAIRVILIIPLKTSPMGYISTSILKGACNAICPLIVKLVNPSFSQGKFPWMFKVGHMTSLPKKPEISLDDMSNYRPI